MSQEEGSVFWEVIVSVILSEKTCIYICLTPNGFRDRAISLCSSLDAWQDALRRETRHILTQVSECTDLDRGILKNMLH
jgi:hypothetical protein